MQKDLVQCPVQTGIFLVGYLNVCIERPWDQWEWEMETIMAAHGLEEQVQKYMPHP